MEEETEAERAERAEKAEGAGQEETVEETVEGGMVVERAPGGGLHCTTALKASTSESSCWPAWKRSPSSSRVR